MIDLTWRRVVDQGQSLGGHCRRKCTRKTGQFHILHESNEMRDMTWTSWEQSHEYQTKMRNGWSRCHGQYCQKTPERSSRQRHDTFCDPVLNEVIVDVQKSGFGRMMFADWWELSKLLEVRWSMRRDLTTRSIILEMRDRLEIGW